MLVVQVMVLIWGRHLLSADGPGSVERGGCASGDDGDAGGFPAGAYVGSSGFHVGRG